MKGISGARRFEAEVKGSLRPAQATAARYVNQVAVLWEIADRNQGFAALKGRGRMKTQLATTSNPKTV